MTTIIKGRTWRRVVEVWLNGLGLATVSRGLGFAGDDIGAEAGWVSLSMEVKNHRAFDLAGWVDQAEKNARPDQVPVVVAHRRGRASADDAYVIMSGRAFARLLAAGTPAACNYTDGSSDE